ncbi:MAG: haloacid dehalogenase, partial [Gammaproteobacteria bacterium]
GWCVASEPESVEALSHDVNTLERDQDAQRIWRTYVNDQLDGPYRKLFDRLDSLIFLQAPHFDDVWRWRWQQEKKLHARVLKSGKGAAKGLMTQDEIKKFVAHYQRVTQQNLNCLPRRADVVFRLDSHRRIQAASGRLVQEGVLTFGGANGNFY